MRLNVARQLFILSDSLGNSAAIFVQSSCVLALRSLYACVSFRVVRRRFRDLWFLWAPAIVVWAAYCLVYINARYVAGPCALISFSVLASVWNIRLSKVEIKMVVLSLVVTSLIGMWKEIYLLPSLFVKQAIQHAEPWGFHYVQVAEFMRTNGLKSGDRIAYIGDALGAIWAELDEVQIIAVISPRKYHDDSEWGRPQRDSFEDIDRFWSGNRQTQEEVLGAFRRAGAKWIVADCVPNWADTSEWKMAGAGPILRDGSIPSTYFRRLDPLAQ